MGDISKDIQTTFKTNKLKAFINIKYTGNWINSIENEYFKTFGLSPQQYNILRILRGAKKPIKVQVIKERMIERAPNATRLMDKLCDKKLIKRERCEHDRRVVFISITRQGLKLLEAATNSPKMDVLKNISDEEASQLSDLLDKIR